jgi:hypothetical protein
MTSHARTHARARAPALTRPRSRSRPRAHAHAHALRLSLGNYGGSFVVAQYSSVNGSTQIAATGCAQ